MEDEVENKKRLRFACLEMACRQTETLENNEGQHYSRDLTTEEAVAMADAFYKFVTKQELN